MPRHNCWSCKYDDPSLGTYHLCRIMTDGVPNESDSVSDWIHSTDLDESIGMPSKTSGGCPGWAPKTDTKKGTDR